MITRGHQRVKRTGDLVIGLIGVALLAVPFAVIAIAIKLNSKGPTFFRQERVGKNGRPFRIWKFRTMVEGAVHQGLGYDVVKGDPRITRVGRVLRILGLDELPQLFNVLSGEMSLVGPRPTLGYQVKQYDETQRKRLLARPGITSLAVVSGRNALTWPERIKLDVWYVDHWSFWVDVKILFKTLWVVLVTRKGIYEDGDSNEPFERPPVEAQVDGKP